MDIVRTISKTELETIKEIHDGAIDSDAPYSLIDAVCWFLCGVACMRIWGYKKPVSMLVHTSQKTMHHRMIANVISNWLEETDDTVILERTKEVWDREIKAFTLEKFREQYPGYDRADSEINNYPTFTEIADQIQVILDAGISHIPLGDDGDLTYHEGIHLCIDNCTNNGISSDGMHVRLAYPEATKMPEPAPAFIVVGGATLSRGLTLEGLMSTFFIRSVGQADTLMQMGRWFGYRKKYELLPRLWMTEKTKAQFVFLSALDQELRDEIQYMDINGRSPSEYGPKVKNSPKVSFIRITAKNKMQAATASEMDYSGASNQTYLFDNDREILSDNKKCTELFLNNLGNEWSDEDKYGLRKNAHVWRGIPFSEVRSFLEQFKFQERLKVFNDTKPLLDWIEKVTGAGKLGDWNIIAAGKKDAANGTWKISDNLIINKVKRTGRRVNPEQEDDNSVLNIGVLRDPRDMLADMDIDAVKNEDIKAKLIQYITSGESKAAMAYRDMSGLETTPQMIIYCIDKDSKVAGRQASTRIDLNAPEDLIGICLYIPGGKINTSYTSKISIKMKNDLFDGDADMEGTDEY
ncbi:MAG: Z1 domain-containing protein [Eubacterium sp.]|nr:Z1 domain-containing protein [Eubacterium sp.]